MGYPKLGHDGVAPLRIVEAFEEPLIDLTPNTAWRARDKKWAEAVNTQVAEDIIYQLALDGASAQHIGNLLGISKKNILAAFEGVIIKAHAELAMKIMKDQINVALTSSQINMKQYVGKYFAGQLDNAVVTTDDGDSKIDFEVRLVQVKKDEAKEPSQPQ